MTKIQNSKQFDLEERTLNFAKRVNAYVNRLPKTISNIENGKQLVKAAGSTGANYIEANEALSKKDFNHRVKISRKEAKETVYWLKLIIEANQDWSSRIDPLLQEAIELKKILSSIIEKSK